MCFLAVVFRKQQIQRLNFYLFIFSCDFLCLVFKIFQLFQAMFILFIIYYSISDHLEIIVTVDIMTTATTICIINDTFGVYSHHLEVYKRCSGVLISALGFSLRGPGLRPGGAKVLRYVLG